MEHPLPCPHDPIPVSASSVNNFNSLSPIHKKRGQDLSLSDKTFNASPTPVCGMEIPRLPHLPNFSRRFTPFEKGCQ
jgi:hypothetical protein